MATRDRTGRFFRGMWRLVWTPLVTNGLVGSCSIDLERLLRLWVAKFLATLSVDDKTEICQMRTHKNFHVVY
jgi:hypothetical protein